jgi:GT2 family glycosyltransferase
MRQAGRLPVIPFLEQSAIGYEWMTDFPLVIVILVNWNRWHDTLNCIQSLVASSYPNYKIIVVDNGSSDDSLRQLRRQGTDFILLEAGDNKGFTGGNNLGIRHALNLNADYVLLLNNDTLVALDALEKIVQVAEADKRIGIVTPKILFHPQRQLIWAAGTDFNRYLITGYLTGYKLEDAGRYDQARDLVWVTGCAMLIRRKVFTDVGMLCDEYFAVYEDLDYCLRTAQQNYRICYEPSAVIWHKESASSGGFDAPQYVYYQTRNYLLLNARWARSLRQLVVSRGFIFLYCVKRILRLSLQGKWRSVLGVLYGIRDGLIGHLGRREYPLLAIRQRSK